MLLYLGDCRRRVALDLHTKLRRRSSAPARVLNSLPGLHGSGVLEIRVESLQVHDLGCRVQRSTLRYSI